MSCRKFERWAALSLEAGLSLGKARKLAAHREKCAECRALAEGLEETRAALAGLEAVPEAALDEVRSRVLREARRAAPRQARGGAWRWALAAAAAAVLAALFWPAPAPPPVRVARKPEVVQPLRPAEVAKPEPVAARRAPAARVRKRPRARQPAPQPPLLVRMQVDDPDIVILWWIDRNGG